MALLLMIQIVEDNTLIGSAQNDSGSQQTVRKYCVAIAKEEVGYTVTNEEFLTRVKREYIFLHVSEKFRAN